MNNKVWNARNLYKREQTVDTGTAGETEATGRERYVPQIYIRKHLVAYDRVVTTDNGLYKPLPKKEKYGTVRKVSFKLAN